MMEFYLIDYRMPLGSFKVYFLEGLLYPLRTVLLVTPFIVSLCDGGGLKISIETIVNRDWTPSKKLNFRRREGHLPGPNFRI